MRIYNEKTMLETRRKLYFKKTFCFTVENCALFQKCTFIFIDPFPKIDRVNFWDPMPFKRFIEQSRKLKQRWFRTFSSAHIAAQNLQKSLIHYILSSFNASHSCTVSLATLQIFTIDLVAISTTLSGSALS